MKVQNPSVTLGTWNKKPSAAELMPILDKRLEHWRAVQKLRGEGHPFQGSFSERYGGDGWNGEIIREANDYIRLLGVPKKFFLFGSAPMQQFVLVESDYER